MFCPNCGTEVNGNERFCPNCGAEITPARNVPASQALVFHLFSLLCFVPVIGWLWAIYMLICFILGVIWAAEQEPKELPLIGQIKLIFD